MEGHHFYREDRISKKGRELCFVAVNSLILLAVICIGIVVIVLIRESYETDSGRGDCDETWEQTLTEYKTAG